MDERNNSGSRNSGHRNSGYFNSGNYNSGNRNSGNCNSGNFNLGNYNSGNRNSGHRNSGYFNSGNYNSGNSNSGNRNSGNFNSGNFNLGDFNSGDYNSGYFCAETPKPVFFDTPVDMTWKDAASLVPCINLPIGRRWVSESEMTDDEKAANPNYAELGGYLKEMQKDFKSAFKQWWATGSDEVKQRFLSLPNFDAEKFLQITGVDVRQPAVTSSPAVPQEVIVDGRRYVLAPDG